LSGETKGTKKKRGRMKYGKRKVGEKEWGKFLIIARGTWQEGKSRRLEDVTEKEGGIRVESPSGCH